MPRQVVPGTDLVYHLISFRKDGRERTDDPAAGAHGGKLSEMILAELRKTDAPVTDVYFVSHGWKGDVGAAIRQYDAWIGAMAACEADRAAVRQMRTGYKPLLVGLHWPSLPWGDEDQPTDEAGFVRAAGAIAEGDAPAGAIHTLF